MAGYLTCKGANLRQPSMRKRDKEFRIAWDDNSTSSSQSSKSSGPLREYRIKFEKVQKGKKGVPDPNKLGVRSKLGGEPD